MNVNSKLKIALPCLILALVLPMLALLFTAKPVEAGCGCGGGDGSQPPPVTMTVSVDISPYGGGEVEVGGWLSDSYPATHTVVKGENVRLEAVPASGYYFVSWGGDLNGNENPIDVLINTDSTVFAHFFPEEFISGDEMLRVAIPEGTIVLDKDNEPLISLELTINETLLPPPSEANIVGLSYNLGPSGTTFNKSITITCSYAQYEIPPEVAEEDLVMAYYDEDVGEWMVLPSVVDTVNNIVTTLVNHLTTFTIIAPIPPPAPAAFTPSSLSISPLEANIGETVNISVLVTNTGEQEGNYIVTLKINEVIEETREITLAGGSETVTFTTTKDKAGTYSVDVNGLYSSFEVKGVKVKWAILWPSLVAVIFLTTFLSIRLVRRRTFR